VLALVALAEAIAAARAAQGRQAQAQAAAVMAQQVRVRGSLNSGPYGSTTALVSAAAADFRVQSPR